MKKETFRDWYKAYWGKFPAEENPNTYKHQTAIWRHQQKKLDEVTAERDLLEKLQVNRGLFIVKKVKELEASEKAVVIALASVTSLHSRMHLAMDYVKKCKNASDCGEYGFDGAEEVLEKIKGLENESTKTVPDDSES
jgi:hypothetical protein